MTAAKPVVSSITSSMSKTNSKPIVIFGASVTGAKTLDLVDPVCFVDNDPNKRRHTFYGKRVLSFERLLEEYPDAVIVIAASRYYDEILEQVSPYYSEIYRFIREIPKDKFIIPQINVVVTEKCTLKCKHCSSLMPLYKEPTDVDLGHLITSLDHILRVVDGVERVEVLGGEPFLNKDLPTIINYLVQSPIERIDVVTNGMVIPHDLSYLNHPKVCVVINNYTGKSKLELQLAKYAVQSYNNFHWKWADMGGIYSRDRYLHEAKDLFKRCNFHNCSELLRGVLYRCPRSSHGTNLGLLPKFPDDFVDVYGTPIGELREKLEKLYKKDYLGACDYCSGNTRETLTLKAGEQ